MIHQNHLQSTALGAGFYNDAANQRSWEVAEVRIFGGLTRNANAESITKTVQFSGLHVVRCNVEMDPVNNTCRGTCRVQVRYNPDLANHPVDGLLRYLESSGLR